jgi:TolA-binding protein
MRMKFFPGLAAWLAFALAVHADISDAPTDTNAPVAQPVTSDIPAPLTAPKAQPLAPPPDGSAPAAQPAAQPVAPSAPSDADNTGATSADNAASGTGLTVVSLASARFDSANAAYDAGRYADAVRDFTEFVRTFPADRRAEEAFFHLAESYRELGRTRDALAAYTYQVGHFPQGPFRVNAELQRGAILFDQKKIADAIPPLQYAFDHGEGVLRQDAEYLLARAFLATQKEAAGRALLQSLVDEQPPGKLAGSAAQALAEFDDAQGKPADALANWRKAAALLSGKSAQATAAARGGWSALAAKQPADAQKLFEQARELGATGSVLEVANTGLLRVLFAQKKYADWLKLYATEKEHVLASARSEILYDFGHAEFSLQQWPDAVVAFDDYLKEFPASPAASAAAYERMLAAIQADSTQTLPQAEAYLTAWPQSPYRPRVELLEAQEYSREQKFADAAPLWEKLAAVPAAPDWPHRAILLERARTYDELKQWKQAADAYRAYIAEDDQIPAKTMLSVGARLAVCLQNDGQTIAATEAWKAVQAQAPAGSSEQQAALESLGLIYARGGPSQASLMAQTFRDLLAQFPQTKLRALAAFSVGDYLFSQRDYAGAEPYLLEARTADLAHWNQAATQRLALGAYGSKDWTKLLNYVQDYDAIPGVEKSAPLPAPLFYALAQNAQKNKNLAVAEESYRRVTLAPDAGDLQAPAWWQLGQVQAAQKEWIDAVASFGKYEELKPDAAKATAVLLALGRAQLGAAMLDAAKATAQQALLQEPEGPNSAAARMLLAETAYAAGSFPEAARMFATLALLFDNSPTAPQAMSRAADAFEKAGDPKSAADWRAKLQAKYPDFKPAPYL